MTTERSRAVELVDRFIDAGAADQEACEWFRTALATHRRASGSVSFETVAHLPISPAGWAAVRRDNALRAAAQKVCSAGPLRSRAEELKRVLDRAVMRGAYARWCAAGDRREPDAVLLAIQLHGDEAPSLSTIRRALGAGSEIREFLAGDHRETLSP